MPGDRRLRSRPICATPPFRHQFNVQGNRYFLAIKKGGRDVEEGRSRYAWDFRLGCFGNEGGAGATISSWRALFRELCWVLKRVSEW